MAQLTLDLTQFKSAGVYTLEIDETVSYTVETNALRLLVGFSAKGPFNKPVFLRNVKDAQKIYGEINEKLEHKGSYFNRFAETLAARTPIFALNLLRVDETVQGPDQVNYAAMSLDAGKPNPAVSSYNKAKYGETNYSVAKDSKIYLGEGKSISKVAYIGNAPYASLFDRTRFWDPSDENLLATAALGLPNNPDNVTFEHTNFLNFANIGTSELAILVFKPENLSGYAVTCSEWYDGKQNIPYGFIRPNDYVEDYFIQVVAVKGNWTNYTELSVDPVWSDFFDENGIKKNKINSFISASGVTLLGSWIGSIIPGFQNKAGEFVDIVEKINNNSTVTGLLASFNKDAANVLRFDYDGIQNEDGETVDPERNWFIDDDGDGEQNEDESAVTESTYQIDMVGHNFQKGYVTSTAKEDLIQKTDDEGNLLWEEGVDEFGNPIPMTEYPRRYGINFLSYCYDSDGTEVLTEPVRYAKYFKDCGVDEFYNGPVKSDIKNMFIIADKIQSEKLSKGDLVNNDPDDVTIIPGLTKVIKKIWVSLTAEGEFENGTVFVEDATYTYNGSTYTYNGYAIYDAQFGKLGFYLYSTIESVALTYYKVEEEDEEEDSEVAEILNISLTGDNKIPTSALAFITKQHKISEAMVSSHLRWIPLKGLSINKRHMPGYDKEGNIDVEGGIEKIYSMLADAGIKRGLNNPQMIQFRYIIDSMSHGIAPMMGGKVYLSQLAKEHGKCTALLNAPSKREFTRSANPYFCDTFVNGVDIKPAFNTEYIPLGGNDEIYSENKFSLPDEDNGATFTGVFFPNLIYSVGGKKVSVPPAADVANVLIRKFTGGDPYMICANNNGVISNKNLYGLEFALDTPDRDSLEPFGINSIITRDGNIMVYGNQTTYQRVKSDLNKLHIRENLNTIEIACDAILQNYVFLYNNAQTRADIVQKLTPVLQAAQTSGAIDTFTIQCDENNNTEEIISSDYGVVDITVVMNHGMEKIVQRITLKRNGTSQN